MEKMIIETTNIEGDNQTQDKKECISYSCNVELRGKVIESLFSNEESIRD